MKNLFLLGAAMLATACGSAKPVQIDSSEAPEFAAGHQVVGLLEVHHVNTGEGFGLPIQETYNESFYCTVSVVNPSTVVTSTDCLQTIKQEGSNTSSATNTETSTSTTFTFDPKNMTVHLPVSGKVAAHDYDVTAIGGTDGANHLAYLKLASRVASEQVAAAISFQTAAKIPATPTSGTVSGVAVSATPPDKNGISHLRRSNVAIAFTAAPSSSVNLNPNPPTSANPANTPVSPQATPSIYGQPQSVTVSGLKDGSFGAPVFFSHTMIGIVQNGSSDNVTNGQWIVDPQAVPKP